MTELFNRLLRSLAGLLLMDHKVVTDYTNVTVENANVKVFVRARPPEDGNPVSSEIFETSPEAAGKITMNDPANKGTQGGVAFMFDRIFWTDSDQAQIFDAVCKPQVDHCGV